MSTNTHTVLYDPQALIEAELTLDRGPYMSLVKAVLVWADDVVLQPGDCEQLALQLTGHVRAVAMDVRRRCSTLPVLSRTRILTEVILAEADLRLAEPYQGTTRCVRQRAHMVKALCERLDRLASPAEAPPA